MKVLSYEFPIIYLNLEALKMAKPKKCKVCEFPFNPRATTQVVCSPNCAVELNKQRAKKKFNDETTRRKKALKTKSEYAEEAQAVFNRYVRLRDDEDPCISCGRYHTGQYHAKIKRLHKLIDIRGDQGANLDSEQHLEYIYL
ncbi:unnamed protein product, partial [marine sediment metagenome]